METTSVEPPTCGPRTIVRTWRTEDQQENTNEFTQTIHVLADTTAPQWDYFPEDTTVLLLRSGEQGSISPEYTGWPTFIEACKDIVHVSYQDDVSILDTSCPGEKLITRTWNATDSCGNVNLRIQEISITIEIDGVRALWDSILYQVLATSGSLTVQERSTIGGSAAASSDIMVPNKEYSIAKNIRSRPPTVQSRTSTFSRVPFSKQTPVHVLWT